MCDDYREKLEAARQEERGARTAHGDKRNDLNSVQSMIGRMNRANSIQEIDDMVSHLHTFLQFHQHFFLYIYIIMV